MKDYRVKVFLRCLDITRSKIKLITINVLLYEDKPIDDYAKDGRPEMVWHLCSFYQESLRTWIKTVLNKFAISNHTALILGVYALRSYLKLICEYELHSLK